MDCLRKHTEKFFAQREDGATKTCDYEWIKTSQDCLHSINILWMTLICPNVTTMISTAKTWCGTIHHDDSQKLFLYRPWNRKLSLKRCDVFTYELSCYQSKFTAMIIAKSLHNYMFYLDVVEKHFFCHKSEMMHKLDLMVLGVISGIEKMTRKEIVVQFCSVWNQRILNVQVWSSLLADNVLWHLCL